MSDSIPYRLLADLVLLLHVAVVLFVVAGLVLVVAGNVRGWRWVNAFWFRGLHLFAIGVVAAQAWLGIVCPLTTLEMWLRAQAGQATYGGDFVGYWLQRLLFYDAPAWLFTLVYTVFGLVTTAVWWRYPASLPRRAARTSTDPVS
jgi:polyferredoxin